MKLRLTLVAVPVLALVGRGGRVCGARRTCHQGVGAAAAAIACGTTRTIGVAAPITGPAASIGQQQLRWAQFYVKRWNALKANAKQKIAIVQGDTQLGVDTAFAVKVAQSFASNPKVLGRRRPGRQPGGRRVDLRAPGRRARLGLRRRRHASRSPTVTRTASTGRASSSGRCRTTTSRARRWRTTSA